MPKRLKLNAMALVDEARRHIQAIDAAEAMALHATGECLIVDVRDARERARDGFIPGSMHCPRGMVEFWIDPESPYAKPIFQQDKKFIFHCASGWRSALAAKTAQDMGLKPVAHLGGGFTAWREAGGPVEKVEAKK